PRRPRGRRHRRRPAHHLPLARAGCQEGGLGGRGARTRRAALNRIDHPAPGRPRSTAVTAASRSVCRNWSQSAQLSQGLPLALLSMVDITRPRPALTEGPDVISSTIAEIGAELIDFRRDIHAHPELSFQEFETTDKIVARLEAAGLQPRRLEGTGVVCEVGDGPLALGLRADID